MQDKSIKLKVKVTYEWEYKVQSQDYFKDGKEHTVEEIIEVDKQGFYEDEFMFLECCKNEPTIEIIEVKQDE